MKSTLAFFSLALLLCISCAQAQNSCALCQFAVQYIDGYLQQNYTQAQIIKQLEVVCALSPEPFRGECDCFVERYVPVLVNYIIKYEDPQNGCAQLRFCSSSAAKHSTFINQAIINNDNSDELCTMCTTAVTSLEAFVKQNKADVAQINSYLDNLCRLTPVATQCSQLVNSYSGLAIQIIQSANPRTVCQQLTMCRSANYGSQTGGGQPDNGPQQGGQSGSNGQGQHGGQPGNNGQGPQHGGQSGSNGQGPQHGGQPGNGQGPQHGGQPGIGQGPQHGGHSGNDQGPQPGGRGPRMGH